MDGFPPLSFSDLVYLAVNGIHLVKSLIVRPISRSFPPGSLRSSTPLRMVKDRGLGKSQAATRYQQNLSPNSTPSITTLFPEIMTYHRPLLSRTQGSFRWARAGRGRREAGFRPIGNGKNIQISTWRLWVSGQIMWICRGAPHSSSRSTFKTSPTIGTWLSRRRKELCTLQWPRSGRKPSYRPLRKSSVFRRGQYW